MMYSAIINPVAIQACFCGASFYKSGHYFSCGFYPFIEIGGYYIIACTGSYVSQQTGALKIAEPEIIYEVAEGIELGLGQIRKICVQPAGSIFIYIVLQKACCLVLCNRLVGHSDFCTVGINGSAIANGVWFAAAGGIRVRVCAETLKRANELYALVRDIHDIKDFMKNKNTTLWMPNKLSI